MNKQIAQEDLICGYCSGDILKGAYFYDLDLPMCLDCHEDGDID